MTPSRGTLPLSGWDFDLSEWPAAKALWDALQGEERGEPRGLRDGPGGESDDESDESDDDDERNDRRSDVGHGERTATKTVSLSARTLTTASRNPPLH